MPVAVSGQTDEVLERIAEALQPFNAVHSSASIQLFRSNPYCVRIRVVDVSFCGMSGVARHKIVWSHLDRLNDDDLGHVSQLLLFAPDELQSSVNMDFDESRATPPAQRAMPA